jgi:hypothetical protein
LGKDVADNDYKLIYRNWEDSLASKLYQLHQMPEDRIAATLQLYAEKKQDREVSLGDYFISYHCFSSLDSSNSSCQ